MERDLDLDFDAERDRPAGDPERDLRSEPDRDGDRERSREPDLERSREADRDLALPAIEPSPFLLAEQLRRPADRRSLRREADRSERRDLDLDLDPDFRDSSDRV